VTPAVPRCDSKYRSLPPLRATVEKAITRKRLAATSSSCLALLVIQLLVGKALIDREAVTSNASASVTLPWMRALCGAARSPCIHSASSARSACCVAGTPPEANCSASRLWAFIGCVPQPTPQTLETLETTPRRSGFLLILGADTRKLFQSCDGAIWGRWSLAGPFSSCRSSEQHGASFDSTSKPARFFGRFNQIGRIGRMVTALILRFDLCTAMAGHAVASRSPHL